MAKAKKQDAINNKLIAQSIVVNKTIDPKMVVSLDKTTILHIESTMEDGTINSIRRSCDFDKAMFDSIAKNGNTNPIKVVPLSVALEVWSKEENPAFNLNGLCFFKFPSIEEFKKDGFIHNTGELIFARLKKGDDGNFAVYRVLYDKNETGSTVITDDEVLTDDELKSLFVSISGRHRTAHSVKTVNGVVESFMTTVDFAEIARGENIQKGDSIETGYFDRIRKINHRLKSLKFTLSNGTIIDGTILDICNFFEYGEADCPLGQQSELQSLIFAELKKLYIAPTKDGGFERNIRGVDLTIKTDLQWVFVRWVATGETEKVKECLDLMNKGVTLNIKPTQEAFAYFAAAWSKYQDGNTTNHRFSYIYELLMGSENATKVLFEYAKLLADYKNTKVKPYFYNMRVNKDKDTKPFLTLPSPHLLFELSQMIKDKLKEYGAKSGDVWFVQKRTTITYFEDLLVKLNVARTEKLQKANAGFYNGCQITSNFISFFEKYSVGDFKKSYGTNIANLTEGDRDAIEYFVKRSVEMAKAIKVRDEKRREGKENHNYPAFEGTKRLDYGFTSEEDKAIAEFPNYTMKGENGYFIASLMTILTLGKAMIVKKHTIEAAKAKQSIENFGLRGDEKSELFLEAINSVSSVIALAYDVEKQVFVSKKGEEAINAWVEKINDNLGMKSQNSNYLFYFNRKTGLLDKSEKNALPTKQPAAKTTTAATPLILTKQPAVKEPMEDVEQDDNADDCGANTDDKDPNDTINDNQPSDEGLNGIY